MDDLLNDVSENQAFMLANGKRVMNLFELRECLNDIDNDTFNHHVNDHKNDFENWVKNSVGDGILADRIAGMKKLDEMFKTVHDRIDELKREKPAPVKTAIKNIPEKLNNINKLEYWNGIIDFALGVAVGFVIALLIKSLI